MTIVIKIPVVHVVHVVYVMMQSSKESFFILLQKISAILESLEFKEFNFHAFYGNSFGPRTNVQTEFLNKVSIHRCLFGFFNRKV